MEALLFQAVISFLRLRFRKERGAMDMELRAGAGAASTVPAHRVLSAGGHAPDGIGPRPFVPKSGTRYAENRSPS
jgi:hypothetical protein